MQSYDIDTVFARAEYCLPKLLELRMRLVTETFPKELVFTADEAIKVQEWATGVALKLLGWDK